MAGGAGFGTPDWVMKTVLVLPKVSSYSYFDLGLGYEISESLNLHFGVNNLLEKQAPNMANQSLDNNTDARLYDIFGRSYYFSFNYTLH
jgi:outer membrane receptor for ferrienterochelin and colicin